jgi:acylphosphatase
MNRVHLFISGFVQGVGFRAFVSQYALELGLAGWVKNTLAGGVEAVFEGPEKSLKQIIVLCRQGPAAGRVSSVEVFWEKPEGLNGFEVKK